MKVKSTGLKDYHGKDINVGDKVRVTRHDGFIMEKYGPSYADIGHLVHEGIVAFGLYQGSINANEYSVNYWGYYIKPTTKTYPEGVLEIGYQLGNDYEDPERPAYQRTEIIH